MRIPTARCLVVLYADGWVEVSGDKNVAVRIENALDCPAHMRALADEVLHNDLPQTWWGLWPKGWGCVLHCQTPRQRNGQDKYREMWRNIMEVIKNGKSKDETEKPGSAKNEIRGAV